MRILSCLVVLCVLCCPAARAGEPAESARMLLEYPAFVQGDRDGVVRFALTASKELTGTPFAELAVRMALYYDPWTLSTADTGEEEARSALGAGTDMPQEYRDLLYLFISRSLAASGRIAEAAEMHRRRGQVQSWLLAGPFTDPRVGLFATRTLPTLPPRMPDDIPDALPSDADMLRWTQHGTLRSLPDSHLSPYVRPWLFAPLDADGPMLLLTGLQLDAQDDAAEFHVLADGSWRLFVDGAQVAEMDKTNEQQTAEHFVQLPLQGGTHSVALQVWPPSLGQARDARVGLRIATGVKFSWDAKLAQQDITFSTGPRRLPQRPRWFTELEKLRASDPALSAAYALACLNQSMPDEGYWWIRQAIQASPDNPVYHTIASYLAESDPLLSDARRQDKSLGHLRAALEHKPGFIPALMRMADSALAPDCCQLMAVVESASKDNPGIDVLFGRARHARRHDDVATVRDIWAQCARLFPGCAAGHLAAADPQSGYGSTEQRIAAARAAAAACPGLASIQLLLAELHADAASANEAEYALRAAEEYASYPRMLTQISALYMRLGMPDKAIRTLSKAVRVTPADPALWRLLGDCRMEAGDQKGATDCWRVSLAAAPGQFDLAAMADHLQGRNDAFVDQALSAHDVRVDWEAAADVPGHIVRLLDRQVLQFEWDGSYRRLTHEIDLVRDRTGGEQLASISAEGELLAARIIFPDGRTIEREPWPDANGLRLPVIPPGSAREIQRVQYYRTERTVPPQPSRWYFRDTEGRIRYMTSELVVRAPRGFPLRHVFRNPDNSVSFAKTTVDGWDIYRWTARHDPAAAAPGSSEPDSVHVSESLPWVEVGIAQSWENTVWRELRRQEGRFIPSAEMRMLAEGGSRLGSAESKARSLYRYVLDNIEPSWAHYGRTAAHVLADRMGGRLMLLLGLLRTAGFDAQYAAARQNPRYEAPPLWELPGRQIFTIPLIRLAIPGGGVYWLDTRFDTLPFGTMADDLAEATVLVFSPSGPQFETLPALARNHVRRTDDRMIWLPDSDGSLRADVRTSIGGAEGLRRGMQLAAASPMERRLLALQRQYDVFPDARLTQFDILHSGLADGISVERTVLTGGQSAQPRDDGVFVASLCLSPAKFISAAARSMAKRTTVCHITRDHVATDVNTFILPPGRHFERIPQSVQIPCRFGFYQLRFAALEDNRLRVTRSWNIPAQRIQPLDWPDFLQFLNRIDLAEAQWIEYK